MAHEEKKQDSHEPLQQWELERNQYFQRLKQNKKWGVFWLVIGILSFIMGIVLLIYMFENYTSQDDVIGAIGTGMIVIGSIIAIYGRARKNGQSSSEIIQELNEYRN